MEFWRERIKEKENVWEKVREEESGEKKKRDEFHDASLSLRLVSILVT